MIEENLQNIIFGIGFCVGIWGIILVLIHQINQLFYDESFADRIDRALDEDPRKSQKTPHFKHSWRAVLNHESSKTKGMHHCIR